MLYTIIFIVSTTITNDWPCTSFDRLVFFSWAHGWNLKCSLSLSQLPPFTFPFSSLAWVYSSSWSSGVFSQQVREGQRHRALQAVGCLNLSRKAFHSVMSDSLYTVLILCLAASISAHFLSLTFYHFSVPLKHMRTHTHSLSLYN